MGLFKSVFNSDGTVSVEHTIGNMRYDLMKPGEGPLDLRRPHREHDHRH